MEGIINPSVWERGIHQPECGRTEREGINPRKREGINPSVWEKSRAASTRVWAREGINPRVWERGINPRVGEGRNQTDRQGEREVR